MSCRARRYAPRPSPLAPSPLPRSRPDLAAVRADVQVTDRPVVLLTGASRGIGAHTARWLAAGGAHLALVARDATALARVGDDARKRGIEVLELGGDITEAGAAEGLVAAVLDRFGRLNSLINNAGIAGPVGHV